MGDQSLHCRNRHFGRFRLPCSARSLCDSWATCWFRRIHCIETGVFISRRRRYVCIPYMHVVRWSVVKVAMCAHRRRHHDTRHIDLDDARPVVYTALFDHPVSVSQASTGSRRTGTCSALVVRARHGQRIAITLRRCVRICVRIRDAIVVANVVEVDCIAMIALRIKSLETEVHCLSHGRPQAWAKGDTCPLLEMLSSVFVH